MDQVLSGTPYMGKDGIWDQFWMMGHFSNDIRNTVGLPFKSEIRLMLYSSNRPAKSYFPISI